MAESATLDDVAGLLRELVAATKPQPAMIDRHQFAELLTIGTTNFDTLRAMGKIGPLPAKLGGSIRWNRAEVLEWLSRRHPDGELLTADEWAVTRRHAR